MRRVAIAIIVLAIAIALVVGIHPVGPARTFDDYEHKAKDTAESVLSSVQTARLTARLASEGRLLGTAASVLLSESDSGVGHAQQVFEGIQPPDAHADVVRARLLRLLDRSAATVQELRIAARRGDVESLRAKAAPLAGLAARLETFVEDHE